MGPARLDRPERNRRREREGRARDQCIKPSSAETIET